MIRRLAPLVLALAAAGGAWYAYAAWQRRLAARPIEWSGTVEARTIEVGSRVGGRVEEVLAREGDAVAAGQPLVVLEAGDLDGRRQQAQGQIEQAEAALARVSGHGSTARVQEIAAARARLRMQEVAIDKARMDLARVRQLIGGGAATHEQVDDAEIALRNATAGRDAQQAALDEILRGTPQDVKAAQGAVDAARGLLAQIEADVRELTIRAPRAAQVETLDLRPGDLLAPAQPAAELLEPDELYVRLYVPETQLGLIRPGLALPLFVDTFPDRPFGSRVEWVSAEGEFTPRNLQTADERADQLFAARLRIESGRDVLRAGMAAFARLPRPGAP